MTNELNDKLKEVLTLLIDSNSRTNESALRKYWYPLSMATYGTDEVMEAVQSMCNFKTTMWEKTLQFERRFADYQGSNDAVMVNSGSSADLLLSFLLTNPLNPLLKPGDEILAPIVTWPTQLWSPMMAGLRLKMVDVNPETLNIDLNDLEAKIGPSTKAIFLVHLMGIPCKMDSILELAKAHNLLIIEDCCEALGADWDGKKVGNFGLGGSFSFFFSHHITTMEGGMICCPNPEITEQLKIMRAHGWLRNVDPTPYKLKNYELDPRYAFVNWGFNFRPTELQAGFGLHQLEKLPAFNARRNQLAEKFFAWVDKSKFLMRPKVPKKANPAWFALPLQVKYGSPFNREDLTNYLEGQGVETRPIVAGNLSKQPAAKLFKGFDFKFPGADTIHETGFYIGLSPMQPDSCIDRLIQSLEDFFKKY